MFGRKTRFWDWFSQVASRLAERLDDPAIVSELDEALYRESGGDLSWELGPGEGGECYLAISPEGDRSMVGKAEAFAAKAPAIPGWRFLVGRQKKEFAAGRLILELPGLGTTDIVAWRFWLEGSGIPGRALVVVFPSGVERMPADDLVAGAEIVLDSLLSEMVRIRCVEEIEVTRSVTDQTSGIKPLELAGRLEAFLQGGSSGGV
jgi:hypothetical protein